jgi:hypothetical protein
MFACCLIGLSIAPIAGCGGDPAPQQAGQGATDVESNDDEVMRDASTPTADKSGGATKPASGASSAAQTAQRDAGAANAGSADGGKKVASAQSIDAGKVLSGLRPKCVNKPSQVIMIGDSYMNWISHTFGDDIARESNQMWRMEAIGAYSMGSGGIGSIPAEFDESIANDPDAHTILMDGGGNDLLVADPDLDFWGDCKTEQAPMLKQCQTIIDKAIAAADSLLQRASKAGIRDVVYFFYPHVPKDTLIGGPNPNAMLDHALPQVRTFCEGVEAKSNGATRCHFVDMVPVFAGHDAWFVDGDIHPNSEGSAAMAKELWSVMKDRCIGQPASSGCCEP